MLQDATEDRTNPLLLRGHVALLPAQYDATRDLSGHHSALQQKEWAQQAHYVGSGASARALLVQRWLRVA